ncbi:MAG: hypothetical protein QXI12_13500 [Candidatus Methanomethyliaceae archaeon]
MIVYTASQLSGSSPPAPTSIPCGGVNSYSVDNFSPWGFDVIDANQKIVWTMMPWSKNDFPIPPNSYNLTIQPTMIDGQPVNVAANGVSGFYVLATSSKLALLSGTASSLLTVISGTQEVSFAPGQSVAISGTPTVELSGTPSVNISNAPSVSIANTPTVELSGTPSVNISNTPSVSVANTPAVNATIENAQINSQVVNEIINTTNAYNIVNEGKISVSNLTANSAYMLINQYISFPIMVNGWTLAFASANGNSYAVEPQIYYNIAPGNAVAISKTYSSASSVYDGGYLFNPSMINLVVLTITPSANISSDTIYISFGLSTYPASTYNFFNQSWTITVPAGSYYSDNTYYFGSIINPVGGVYNLLNNFNFLGEQGSTPPSGFNITAIVDLSNNNTPLAFFPTAISLSGNGTYQNVPLYGIPLPVGHNIGVAMYCTNTQTNTYAGEITGNSMLLAN